MAGDKLENILEALLFAYGEPLSLKKLAKVTAQSPGAIERALGNLKQSLTDRGLKLMVSRRHWQLVADKTASAYITKLIKDEIRAELSRASLEVLAIVAYRGPVSRAQVESIRGVNSSYALRNLTLRGLVARSDSAARAPLYEISLTALRKLGLASRQELPRWREFQDELNKVQALLTSPQ